MNFIKAIGNKARAILGINPTWNTINPVVFGTGPKATAYDSVWTIGGIRSKAEAIAQLPMKFYDFMDRELERLDSTQKQIVNLLNNPSMLFVGCQLWELTAMHYEIDGSAFWVLIDGFGNPIQNPTDMPEGIMVYGKDNIIPRRSESGNRIVGWNLRDGAYIRALSQFQLIRFWKANPKSYLEGMKITDMVGNTLQLDSGAKKTNSNFFKNGARPSGIIQAKSERIQTKELRAYARDFSNDFTSPENAGKIPALPATIDFKQDQSVRDMDFQKLHESNRSEFFGATRVPKFHMGVTDDVNYATAEILDTAYWVGVIQPITKMFEDVVNGSLLLGTGMRMKFSYENVAALRLSHLRVKESENKVEEQKWRIANRMWRMGYAVNAINEYLELGAPVIKDSWANESHDPKELGTANQPTANETNKTLGGFGKSPFDDMANNLKQVFSLVQRGQKEKSIIEAIKENDFEAMDAFCRSVEAESIGPLIPQFEKVMKSYFTRLQSSQIKRIESFLAGDKFQDKAEGERELTEQNVNEVLFSKDKWDAILITDTQALHYKAYQNSIEVVREELGGFQLFQPTDSLVAEEARKLTLKVVGINDRLRNSIREAIVGQIEVGSTHAGITEAVSKVFEDRISRVVTTARTETGIAMNTARYNAISVERPSKQWVSANDSGVRESHRLYASIGSKPMDYQYNKGLSHPQDIRASADEVINCRCVLVAGE